MKLWTLKGRRILIVDDFPAMRSMMRSMLLGYGADNVAEARNGEEALERLAEETKDLVLCDYNLGEGKDGQQVLEEAKQRELLPYASLFVMVTAENTSEMVMGAVEFQPDDYLVKPFTKVVMQMRVRKLEEKKFGLKPISDAIESKDLRRAIALCDKFMHDDPKLIFELMKLKGDLFMRLSDLGAAQELFDKVIEIRDVPWARFGLGRVQFALKQHEAAQAQFETLIANNKTFVCAYDWLAKVYKILGKSDKAQDILRRAVEISPKALLRQRALGEISLANEDFQVAEKAYKYVVREGKNSVHKSPEDYGGLAKVYMKTDSSGKSVLRVLGEMKQDFRNSDPTQQLKSAVVEGVVHKALGNEEQSNAALDRAMQLFGEDPGALSSDAAMELAKACYTLGRKDQGNELIKHVVRNNHEDERALGAARQLFSDLGMADEADALINDTRQEVIDLNNEGVDLAKKGSLQESISLFQRAARAMPENVIVNLNAAQSLIMMMQSGGANAQHLGQTKSYLERVGLVDSGNDRYQKLLGRYHELIKQAPQH